MPEAASLELDDYEGPIEPYLHTNAPRIVRMLGRRYTRALWIIVYFIVLVSIILEGLLPIGSEPVVRAGTLLMLLGICHAALMLRHVGIMDKVKPIVLNIFTDIEKRKIGAFTPEDKLERLAAVRANKRVERAYPSLVSALERHYLIHNLAVVAVGEFLSGFADLLD